MAGITWLHLSDWHQGSENFDEYQKSEAFDRELLSKRLKQDILNRVSISADLAKIDFFIFSGDVVFSGKKAEYQSAIEQLFTPVLEAANLDKSRLFMVPGNHDLDHKKFQYLSAALTRPFNKDAEVKQWLKEESDRRFVLIPFEDYDQFIKDYTGQNQPIYASVAHLDIDGKKVALLGLNSALMCGRNKVIKDGKEEVYDYGYLVVGEPQLEEGLERVGEADVHIAVLHHPFEWLTPFEQFRTKDRLGQNFDFILCGHEHIPQVNMIQGTAGDCLIIPAGAGFDKRVPENPIYTNAYNFVHLDFDTGQVTVYLRRWNNIRSRWDKDTYIYDSGQVSFTLPKLRDRLLLRGEHFAGNQNTAPNPGATQVQPLPAEDPPTVNSPALPSPGPGSSTQQEDVDDNEMLENFYLQYVKDREAGATFETGGEVGRARPENPDENNNHSGTTIRASVRNLPDTRRGCIVEAQEYVKKAYDLLNPKLNILPENVVDALEYLKTAKRDIEQLRALLQADPPPKYARIFAEIDLVIDQIDNYLVPSLQPTASSYKNAQNKFQPLLEALGNLDTLIPR